MTESTGPIVIIEDGIDLEVYPTLEEARRSIESYDVVDGVYEAFDALGRPLRLEALGLRVVIDRADDSVPDPDGLALRIREITALDATLPEMFATLLGRRG